MTDAHEPNDIDGPHEGPIKTPKQLILAVLYAFVVPISASCCWSSSSPTDNRPAAGSDAHEPRKAVAERIRPVGIVEVKDATDVASMKTGEQVFAAQCTACHTRRRARRARSSATPPRGRRASRPASTRLLHSALAGKGQMPPQGGGDFSDFEIARAVVYMADKGGANFPEPQPPRARDRGRERRPPAASAAADRRRRRCRRRTADRRRRLPRSTPRSATRCRTAGPGNAAAASSRRRGDHGRRRRTARRSSRRSAPPATAPASPARRRSATRPPGRRASRRASTR